MLKRDYPTTSSAITTPIAIAPSAPTRIQIRLDGFSRGAATGAGATPRVVGGIDGAESRLAPCVDGNGMLEFDCCGRAPWVDDDGGFSDCGGRLVPGCEPWIDASDVGGRLPLPGICDSGVGGIDGLAPGICDSGVGGID